MIALVMCSLATAASVNAAPVEIDRIVAIVDNDIITRTELQEEMRAVRAQLRQQRITPPSERVLQNQVLERMALNQIQLQLAEEIGIVVDDDTLNQAVSGIAAQNNLSLTEFRNILQQDGYDFTLFRENIRQDMIMHRLRQQHVDSRVNVTDQEIENFLATQRRQGQGSDEYHLGHILIALPDAASPEQIREAREKAEAVLTQLREGADFSETAITSSDSQQALEGGDLGWRKGGELPTLFADVVPRMEPGDISDLIRSAGGFHIIKLLDHRTGDRQVVTQTRARHILIETTDLVDEQTALETLQELRQQILEGASFSALATSHSDDTVSGSSGGDLGWVTPGELVPEFAQAMDRLSPGEVSEPVQSPFGWHLIEVVSRRERDVTEQALREMAREAIYRRKVEEEHSEWLRRLREDAYVEFRL